MDTPHILAPSTSVGVQYPLDAASVSIAAPIAQWTYPAAFTQLVASTGAHFVCCGAVIAMLRAGGASINCAMELATGAASSEVVFDRFGFGTFVSDVATADANVIVFHAQPLTPRYIPSGTRLSARQASDPTATWPACKLYLYGFSVPTPALASRIIDFANLIQGHGALGGDRLPTTDFVTLAHSGSAWTAGAWVEITASVAEDCVIEGLGGFQINGTGRDFGVEFGVGGSGSEVLLPARLPIPFLTPTLFPYGGFVPCPFPLFVKKGSRIVARQRASSTSGTIKVALKVSYLK